MGSGGGARSVFSMDPEHIIHIMANRCCENRVACHPTGQVVVSTQARLRTPNPRFDDLHHLADHFRGNEQIVMAAVSCHWTALQFATEEMRDNPEVLTCALSFSGLALQYATDRLKNDFNTVGQAVLTNGNAIRFASPQLQQSRDIVEWALQNCATALQYCVEEFRADRALVTNQDWRALQFATDDLRGDATLVRTALHQDWKALCLTTTEAQADRDLVMMAVAANGMALLHASAECQADVELINAALASEVVRAGRSVLLPLSIRMLSGQHFTSLFHRADSLFDVFEYLAGCLELPVQLVSTHGSLVRGVEKLETLDELETGMWHELTLVLATA